MLMDQDSFSNLWNLQYLQSEKQLLLSDLSNNPFIKNLSVHSKYMLVFEGIQTKVYEPEETIITCEYVDDIQVYGR